METTLLLLLLLPTGRHLIQDLKALQDQEDPQVRKVPKAHLDQLVPLVHLALLDYLVVPAQ